MFTSAEIKELSEIFGITPVKKKFTVKDGEVDGDDLVWWHNEEGPKRCTINDLDHKQNVLRHPHLYSIKKPIYYTGVIYDEDSYEDE